MTETLKGWIAKEEGGWSLWFFRKKPSVFHEPGLPRHWGSSEKGIELPRQLFPDLTFENSPRECEIVINVKE